MVNESANPIEQAGLAVILASPEDDTPLDVSMGKPSRDPWGFRCQSMESVVGMPWILQTRIHGRRSMDKMA